jgi:uncharacterized membrane protein YbaN (DUF454 family)
MLLGNLLKTNNNCMNLIKTILISLGTLSLCLGIIGIVIPGLPTTPFLLLTAGLYVRSSDRLYQKLISNKWVGPCIIEYRKNEGLTLKDKFYAIVLMWSMIAISCILLITIPSVKLIVLIAGIIGTIVMGFLIPTNNISNRNKH